MINDDKEDAEASDSYSDISQAGGNANQDKSRLDSVPCQVAVDATNEVKLYTDELTPSRSSLGTTSIVFGKLWTQGAEVNKPLLGSSA